MEPPAKWREASLCHGVTLSMNLSDVGVKETGWTSHRARSGEKGGCVGGRDDVDAAFKNARSMNFDQSPDRVRRPDWLMGPKAGRVPTLLARFGGGQGPICRGRRLERGLGAGEQADADWHC